MSTDLALEHINNWHRPAMTETWLDEHTLLLRHHKRDLRPFMPEGDQWWLIVDGVAVGYLHTALHDRAEYPFTLCDIEVREGHRRQGYARRLLRAVQDLVGETIHTTGSFTPLGAAALENRLPVLPGEEPGVKFADMTFVRDWDNLIPHSPL